MGGGGGVDFDFFRALHYHYTFFFGIPCNYVMVVGGGGKFKLIIFSQIRDMCGGMS